MCPRTICCCPQANQESSSPAPLRCRADHFPRHQGAGPHHSKGRSKDPLTQQQEPLGLPLKDAGRDSWSSPRVRECPVRAKPTLATSTERARVGWICCGRIWGGCNQARVPGTQVAGGKAPCTTALPVQIYFSTFLWGLWPRQSQVWRQRGLSGVAVGASGQRDSPCLLWAP